MIELKEHAIFQAGFKRSKMQNKITLRKKAKESKMIQTKTFQERSELKKK